MIIKTAIFAIAAFSLTGCWSRSDSSGSMASGYQASEAPMADSSMLQGSIFPSDTQLVSNDDIGKALDGKVPLKINGGLAVLAIGYLPFMDAGQVETVRKNIAIELQANKYVGKVVIVPRMLMTNKITVSSIREMAARLQCENVLIYTAYTDSRYNWRMFNKNELRVNLTVEGVLLNVRTGVMPIALVRDKESIKKEADTDNDTYEFIRRAQRECLNEGIKDICSNINEILVEVK